MQRTPPQYYTIHGIFNDFDGFLEAMVSWDLDFRQLSALTGTTGLTLVGDADVQLFRARLGCHCDQTGGTAKGFRTFGLPVVGSSPFTWDRQAVGQDALILFGSGGEFESASLSGFEVYSVAISEPALGHSEAGCRLLEFTTGSGTLVTCATETLQALRGHVEHLLGFASATGRLPGDQPAELAGLLWDAVAGGERQSPRLPGAARHRTIARAREWVLANQREALTVAALSRELGVSERTLHRAFIGHYGVSPKDYLQAVRLTGVRRELRRGDPRAIKIHEVAGDFDFWHAGQFAADYRRLFGELPSRTLARRLLPSAQRGRQPL